MSRRNAKGAEAKGADPRWTLVACILASSLSFVDGSVLNVALPAIRASYGAGAAEVQWVVNAYLLPLSALLLLGGALGDHFGRRRLLVIGTSLFGIGSLLCALAPSLPLLLGARAAQGVGAALLLPNSLALLNAAYSGERRGRAVGIWAAAGAAAAAVAPLLGGWLVGTVGWPAIFYINLPLAAGAILLALLFVTESRNPGAGRTDYAGALFATAGLGGATYGLTRWSSSGAFDAITGGSIAASIVLLGAFVAVEKHRDEKAMMPLTLFADRCFFGLNLMTFLLYGAMGAAMLIVPYVLIEAAGYSPIEAGLALLPLAILIAIGSPIMGQLAARIGPRRPLTVGPLVVGAGMLAGLRIGEHPSYWADVLPCVGGIALGMAVVVAPLTSSVLGSVNEQHVALASGFNSAVARIGGLIATALLGVVLAKNGAELIGGLHGALIVSAVVSVAASVAALTLLGRVKMKNA
ncbi:DHA2 family efflux MFS transporter permease subunit [Sphingomonas sp. URHD0057]|uniref:DHA2 family efflux MFS transporter permease subunit n=1 Tax=Sphingomonas sp. URHD0057 TaxID=1380389 RepID=UPI00048B1B1B|nr:DHA2 family efflux MFS transporter permease subunit [Sphingomonas sp. URHD0057]